MFKAEEKIRRQLMKTIKKTILSFTLVFFMMILPVGDSAGMVTAQAQTMVYVTPTGTNVGGEIFIRRHFPMHWHAV